MQDHDPQSPSLNIPTPPGLPQAPDQTMSKRFMAALLGAGSNGCKCEPCKLLRQMSQEIRQQLTKED